MVLVHTLIDVVQFVDGTISWMDVIMWRMSFFTVISSRRWTCIIPTYLSHRPNSVYRISCHIWANTSTPCLVWAVSTSHYWDRVLWKLSWYMLFNRHSPWGIAIVYLMSDYNYCFLPCLLTLEVAFSNWRYLVLQQQYTSDLIILSMVQ